MTLTKEQYINESWEKARFYCNGVLDGTIITCENIKLAVQRHVKDLESGKYEVRVDKVNRVFKFFSYLNVAKDKQFILEPFQAFIILALLGNYIKGTDERKYLYSFLFLGRKNGKTTLVSALQLYFLIADGFSYPRSVLISASQDNAKDTAFSFLEEMIKHSTAIDKRLEIIGNNKVRFKEINGQRKLGWTKTTIMDMDKIEGYKPSTCILDEVHTWKDSRKFDVVKNSLGTEPNPMVFLISTGGYGTDSFCTQLVETGRNVLRGLADDERFFYMLYELDEGDDWQDENNWIKANPGLGTILKFETFRDIFNTSKLIISSLRDFQTKRLNMFLEENSQIVPEQHLLPAFQKFTDEDVKDYPCYLGCDLSETMDLTSIVALWDGDDKIFVKPFFFFVENESNALRKGNVDIHNWIKQDYVISTSKSIIDYDLVKKYLFDLNKKFKVKGLYYDPWHFRAIYNTPKDSKGITLSSDDDSIWCVPVVPGVISFDWPIRFLQGAFVEKKIIIYPNKCMEWNFRNIVVESKDLNGNMRPNKNKSKDSIDGVISLLNCLYGFLGVNDDKYSRWFKQS